MELARADALAKKGINWGKLTFEHILKKNEDLKKKDTVYLGNTDRVQSALRDNLLVSLSDAVDGSAVLTDLDVDDQCAFFSSYPTCKILILRGWKARISDTTLRCLSIAMGESLVEIDMSYSNVDAQILEIMLSHIQYLKIVKLNHCPLLDAACMSLLAKYAGPTIKELYVSHCKLFRLDPLLALSGSIGFGAGGLKALRALDLGSCPVEDRGLVAIAHGCRRLRFVNLEDCRDITDVGVIALAKGNEKLQILNLSGCILITNSTAKSIARNCPDMVSLNFARCNKITNMGIKQVANNCPYLQSLNIAGLLRISEMTLCLLATSCPGDKLLIYYVS
jgi:hypothetical protein